MAYIINFVCIPYEVGNKSGEQKGISSLHTADRCLISSERSADIMNGVFMAFTEAHAHRDDRKSPASLSLSSKPAVCMCKCVCLWA